MVDFWRELLIAVCLVLVIEGVVPFLYPQRWRRLVAKLAYIPDSSLRMAGLVSMVLGVAMLYLVH
ncbi:DUF2065 domain-containing protein [Marinobacterium sp. YM272]|uniref:DUF2065 domain-containing protein n=1 Tax=Marinobacterium sp. YM272 TaxID=3421654 RepID=UPI003D7F2E9D